MLTSNNEVYGIISLIVLPSTTVALVRTNEAPNQRQSVIQLRKMSGSQSEQLLK